MKRNSRKIGRTYLKRRIVRVFTSVTVGVLMILGSVAGVVIGFISPAGANVTINSVSVGTQSGTPTYAGGTATYTV